MTYSLITDQTMALSERDKNCRHPHESKTQLK